MERLSNLEHDALGELLRMRVQRASETLESLCDNRIFVRFERFGIEPPTESSAAAWHVRQRLSGDLEGEGGWWIDHLVGKRLLRRLRRVPVGRHDITPLEREGLLEVGHIFLDGMLTGLALALDLRLRTSVPQLREVGDGGCRALPVSRLCVHISHHQDGECFASSMSLACNAASAELFHRQLALYVSPFLSELSAFGA